MPEQKLEPGLFARIMELPRNARLDVLEFVGSTKLSTAQVERILRTVKQAREPAS